MGFLKRLLSGAETPEQFLHRFFLCSTPAEVDRCLKRAKHSQLTSAFDSIDVTHIPLNTFCTTHYRHPQGTDSRIVSLTIGLACLARSKRTGPAQALARRLLPKFDEKVRRGQSVDRSLPSSDQWHIHGAVKKFLLDSAKELMIDQVGRNDWALPILDAIAIDWPEDDEVLFWRAAAAYNIWCDEKTKEPKKDAARERMGAFLANEARRTMDSESVRMIRTFLEHL
jgi:hypothetical protein